MSEPPAIASLELYLDGEMQCFALAESLICRIGRATRNTIVFSSSQVSRDHALVDCANGKDCVLTDLGSLNGTSVNGVRISGPVVLNHGDIIGIGEFRLCFRSTLDGNEEFSDTSQAETALRMVSEEITVLVVDIRNYTVLTQCIAAEKLSEVVGYFIRESGTLLRVQGAWGQKYIGDAVMAIWVHNQDFPPASFVRRAILCAHSIHEIASTLQRRFQLENPVRVGAALNTGFALLGNLGSVAAADYTALGDAVNKAFRLETATKDVPCDVLIGNTSFHHLAPPKAIGFTSRQLTLKGYAAPEPAYSLSFEDLGSFLNASARTAPR